MATGPVQLLVLGLDDPEFEGEIIDELERLRDGGTVRMIDALLLHKDAGGALEVLPLGDEDDERGRIVAALIGLVVESGEATDERFDDVDPYPQEGWDVLGDIPSDTAAAVVLLEHLWAVPLRDAVIRSGGFRISDGFVSPLDLVDVGLVDADEAEAFHIIETGAPRR